MRYEVFVGSVGSVYTGDDQEEAERTFEDYVEQSKSGYGRAGGEDVTLFKDGDPFREHSGTHRMSKRKRLTSRTLNGRKEGGYWSARDYEGELAPEQVDSVAIAESTFGWAIAEQYADVLKRGQEGEDLVEVFEDQNFNAIGYVEEFARNRADRDSAADLFLDFLEDFKEKEAELKEQEPQTTAKRKSKHECKRVHPGSSHEEWLSHKKKTSSIKIRRPQYVPVEMSHIWLGAARKLASRKRLSSKGLIDYSAVNREYRVLLSDYQRLATVEN